MVSEAYLLCQQFPIKKLVCVRIVGKERSPASNAELRRSRFKLRGPACCPEPGIECPVKLRHVDKPAIW